MIKVTSTIYNLTTISTTPEEVGIEERGYINPNHHGGYVLQY